MLSGTRPVRLTVATALAAIGAAALIASPANAAGTSMFVRYGDVHRGSDGEQDVNACVQSSQAGFAACSAHVRVDAKARGARPAPSGSGVTPNVLGNNGAYDPSFLRSAYNLNVSGGTGLTVAIVDAFDDPNAATNLASYRSFFGIPACGTGCFTKVDQRGGTQYPIADRGWAEEISLDLDMVSAICPNCHILLVEADDNSLANLGAAVNRAVAMGAMAVSNSYGGGEYSGESSDSAAYYNHPGVAVTASSGDSGYGVQFPAASQYVTSVGGTSLNQTGNTGTRNATETAWSGAGSGCSAFISKPPWQTDSCTQRTVADVSAVADPNTGVWVYDTYGGDPGWLQFGGTSVASPIVAGVYALAGQPGATDTPAANPYAHTASLFDITSGSNGSCGGTYLCTAKVGYDGPTGLGTPNNFTAFGTGAPPPPPQGTISLSAAQSLTAGQPSAAMTVSISPAPASPVSVQLSSSSGQGSFSTSSTGTFSSTLTVSVDSSGSSPGFYYKDTAAGSPTITAAATGYTSGTRTESVSAGALAAITLSPSSASVARGHTVRFTASGRDTWGNPVAISGSPAWSVSPSWLGSFGSFSGTSATFTAGGSTGSGTVTATVGSLSGNAAITVRRR